MVEKIGHIKNPLSVIAIFAAIAEISGTTILPFIHVSNQSIYIWFLMFFPVLLVGSFFLTLNFNHRVLYAPSDYKDEKHFISSFSKAKPEERSEKLHAEVEEVEIGEKNSNSTYDTPSIVKLVRSKKREIMADVTLAEKLVINKISKELGLDFKTDIKFNVVNALESSEDKTKNSKMGVIFDAVHISENSISAVEIKLFKTHDIDLSRFDQIVRISELVANSSAEMLSKKFNLHIFAIMDAANVDVQLTKKTLTKHLENSSINVICHVTTLDDLQNEYEYSA